MIDSIKGEAQSVFSKWPQEHLSCAQLNSTVLRDCLLIGTLGKKKGAILRLISHGRRRCLLRIQAVKVDPWEMLFEFRLCTHTSYYVQIYGPQAIILRFIKLQKIFGTFT